ncbi:MAG: respiratory nitrate reductase subunit gamma [Magnetococcus sp. DMHC-6]
MLTLLSYLVLIIFILGFSKRIFLYTLSPAPLKIPTTPAPVNKTGVIWRLFTEVAFFNSLFKGDKLAWIGGYLFHASLIFIAARHLRYFIDPLPSYMAIIQIAGILAGLAMVGGLGLLFARRLFIDRVRFISSPADYFILILLLAIGFSGLLMRFVFRPDIIHIKAAMTGVWTSWTNFLPLLMPGDYLFMTHLLMVMLLMVIFPFSKLMHLGGIFFSPTRNQIDNPRECRHVNPWAKNSGQP